MIRKDKKTYKDGTVKTQIRVVEGYRPGPGLAPKQRTIKDFGYLEDNKDRGQFLTMVEEFDAKFRKDRVIRIETPVNAKMYSKENRRLNYGYKFLESIYNDLEIDAFIARYEKEQKYRGEYSLGEIFKFLVLLRILSPDSKRATCQMKDGYYGFNTEFTLPGIYRALDHYADISVQLQHHINERIKKMIGRDLSYVFYDVTNYYFEIDFPDSDEGLRKRGVSKEHRVDPIVQMGLFIDSNGLPISMSLFPGNISDTLTLRPVMKEIKDSFGLGRLIVVADKGLNSSKNIDEITANGDGYVISQVLRGKKGQRYHTAIFDEDGYTVNQDGSYKYKLFTEEYIGLDKNGKKETRKRKVLIYWSKADADMAGRKREEKLKIADRVTKNAAYGIKKGCLAYTKEKTVNRATGEILDNTKKILTVDTDKAEKDALFDGYFCIITSELDFDERRIRDAYSGLWKIENSFRVMKSDLNTRPVFLSTDSHIRAHFLICFTALLLIRIIQSCMGADVLSVERITRALNAATCQILKGGIIHLDDVGGFIAFKNITNSRGETVDSLVFSAEDEIALDYKIIQNTFHTDFFDIYPKQEVFNNFLKNIHVA